MSAIVRGGRRAALRRAARRWLADARFGPILALLALGLTLPALATGWQFDDYLHRATIVGADGERAVLAPALNELFVFMDGDPAHTRARMARGEFPWWAMPEGQVAFWRPLAGLTHWLDYRLWPRSPALMHAHSLAWFGALVLAVAALYRRFARPTPGATVLAGLAALLYALDDARGFAVGWLANRNVLLATLCGCLALIAHDRWRRDGWRPGLLLAPLLLLSLLAAEAAVAMVGYLVAYAVVLERGGWRERVLSLLPAALAVLLWRLVYRALGYGAWGTSYIDPAREPLRYLQAVVERGPVLLLAQWALPPAELYPFLPAVAARLVWLAALAVIALLAALLLPLLRRDPLARFWAMGCALALLPACAALPANRLLFFVGLGSHALLARLLRLLLAQPVVSRATPRRRWTRTGGAALAAIHLLLAPLLLPLTAYSPALLGNIEPSIRGLPRDPAFAAQTAVFVSAPSFFSTGYIPLLRRDLGLPAPARTRFLGAALVPLQLHRPDAQTLIVRPAGGMLTGFDVVFRDPTHALPLDASVDLGDLRATVVAQTADGRPAAVAYRFTAPLDDPSLRWLRWQDGHYVAFTPPPIGATLHLPATAP